MRTRADFAEVFRVEGLRLSRGRCWLARFDPDTICDTGLKLQVDHLIEKQRIRRAFEFLVAPERLWAIVYDPRIGRAACTAHHHRRTVRAFALDFDDYPTSVLEWANEYGFVWSELDSRWVAAKELVERAAAEVAA